MHNFNSERLTMAAGCTAAARVCLDEATAYAKQRHTFGKPRARQPPDQDPNDSGGGAGFPVPPLLFR